MTKYKRTKEIVGELNSFINEIQELYIVAVYMSNYMCNSDDFDEADFDDIDTAMTRLTGAWEELRRTQKERMTDEP